MRGHRFLRRVIGNAPAVVADDAVPADMMNLARTVARQVDGDVRDAQIEHLERAAADEGQVSPYPVMT
jgi:siroheme synthase